MSLTTKAFFIRAALRLRAGPFATACGWSRVSPYSVLQPKRKKDTFRCPSFWALFANDNDGIRTYFQPQAVGVGFLCTLCPSQNEKKDTFRCPSFWLGHRDSNPGNDGVRVRCLTAWRCPNIFNALYYNRKKSVCQYLFSTFLKFLFFFSKKSIFGFTIQ